MTDTYRPGVYGGLPTGSPRKAAPRVPPRPRPVPRPAAPAPTPVRQVEEFLTPAEVAAELRVSKMTVYRLIHDGDLVAARIGRSFRVPAKAFADYLREARGR